MSETTVNMHNEIDNTNEWPIQPAAQRRNITLVECSMNGLYSKRLDYIQGVMWVPQDQPEEAQHLAPAAPELSLVVTLTHPMARDQENNSACLSRVERNIRTFLGIVRSWKGMWQSLVARRTKDPGFQWTPFVFVLNETRKGIEGRG